MEWRAQEPIDGTSTGKPMASASVGARSRITMGPHRTIRVLVTRADTYVDIYSEVLVRRHTLTAPAARDAYRRALAPLTLALSVCIASQAQAQTTEAAPRNGHDTPI